MRPPRLTVTSVPLVVEMLYTLEAGGTRDQYCSTSGSSMSAGVVTNGVQDISSWRRVLLRLNTATLEIFRGVTATGEVHIQIQA